MISMEWAPRQDSVLEALAKDEELTIFNACIKELGENCSGIHGYGTDAITAMITLSGKGCTLFAPTDAALCDEEFEALLKVFRPKRRKGSMPDPARQSLWLSFLLSHVCDELHEPASLSTLPQVTSVAGDSIQLHLIRSLASQADGHKDTGSSGETRSLSGRTDGDQTQKPEASRWDFPTIRARNGIIYKLDRILTPNVLAIPLAPAHDLD